MEHTNQKETIEDFKRIDELCLGLKPEDEALIHEVMACVTDRWSLWVMEVLALGGTMRFSRIQDQVEGISQKMLTKTLRQFERDGFVKRTIYKEVPPRVEYGLTELGNELLKQLIPVWEWSIGSLRDFKTARARFARQKQK